MPGPGSYDLYKSIARNLELQNIKPSPDVADHIGLKSFSPLAKVRQAARQQDRADAELDLTL